MTASHLQTLPSGPVQLIGLPKTSSAMGITPTSAKILHRRLLVNNNNNVSNAKRCLFGSPEPGELKKLYQEEKRKNREHFIQRYNYDIVKERFVDDNDNIEEITNNNENIKKSTNLTNGDEIIEKNCNNNDEIKERLHEAQKDKISSTSSSLKILSSSSQLPISSTNEIISNNDNDNNCDVITCNLNNNDLLADVENDNNNTTIKTTTTTSHIIETGAVVTSTSTISPSHKDRKSNERLKPYSRQNLLTDYYSSRKLFSTKTTAIIVRQLPKPQKAGLHEESTIPVQHQQNQKHQQQQHQQKQQTEDL